MPLSLHSMPFDILYNISSSLNLEEYLSLRDTDRQLRSVFSGEPICKRAVEVVSLKTSIFVTYQLIKLITDTRIAYEGSAACKDRGDHLCRCRAESLPQKRSIRDCAAAFGTCRWLRDYVCLSRWSFMLYSRSAYTGFEST